MIEDNNDADISAHIEPAQKFIDQSLEMGDAVLVHCMAGISRSATIVIGYLMISKGISLSAAFAHVKSARPCINPNDGFLRTLEELEDYLL